jgi:Protein of unknown function (DUF2934)
LWEEEGHPCNRDREIWERATQLVIDAESEKNNQNLVPQVLVSASRITRIKQRSQSAVLEPLKFFERTVGHVSTAFAAWRAKRKRRKAYQFYREILRQWQAADFVSVADRDRYAKEFGPWNGT